MQFPFVSQPTEAVAQDRRADILPEVMDCISRVKELTGKAKEQARKLEDGLLIHAGYADAVSAVTEAQKGKKDARSAIVAENPDLETQIMSLKQVRADLKDERLRLSDLLLDYETVSGQASIEGLDGVVVRIRKTASIQLELF